MNNIAKSLVAVLKQQIEAYEQGLYADDEIVSICTYESLKAHQEAGRHLPLSMQTE